MSERIRHPFPPVYDRMSRVLILGSFPSVISRAKNFYYANANNRFWPVMSVLFEEEINDREAFCHAHHIALWDVIGECRITGSSDSTIRDAKANDIGGLVQGTDIRAVFTTGRKASDLYTRFIDLPLEHISLPSTSSANASYRLDDLVRAYRKIREYAEED